MASTKYILSNYPLQLQLNFIDLYKADITNRLNQNVNLWKEFSCIVGNEIIEEYYLKHIDAETRELKHEITEALHDEMIKSEQNHLLYAQLVDFMEMVDHDLYQSLCIDKWKRETFSPAFQKLLNILHKIRPIFDIKNVVYNLKQFSSELGQHYQPVIEQWENKKINDEHAKSLIIRTLCILVDGATYHLLYAIYKSNDAAKEVVESIYPKFEIFYQKNVFEDCGGIVYFINNGDNIAAAIEDIMSNKNESKHAYNIFFGSVAPYHLRPLLYPNTADDPINLHDYQKELLVKALKGENTLICAPTGSGKTVIAAYLIREHICDLRKNHQIAKIVFVVPTIVLVQQQTDELKRFLGHCVDIRGLYGGIDDNTDLHSLISCVDIIVLTPKILVNATNPVLCKYDGIDPLSLDIFTMIVLDEVHRTDKGHPYNELMKEYHRCKYGDDLSSPIRSMPQVIGLTASLGTPQSSKRSIDDVIKYMINKCANADIRSYTRVTKKVEESFKLQTTKENTIVVKNSDKLVNEYYIYLQQLIESIESYLKKIDGVFCNPEIFEEHCNLTKSAEYKTWIAITKLISLKKAKLSSSARIKAYKCLDYLDLLYEAYQCAQLFPTEDTTRLYLEDLGNENGSDLDKFVFEEQQKLGKLPSSECDIFKKLIKCINDQFNKDPNSKIIIFTSQRYYCRMGAEIIERYTGKKGMYISGSNASSEEAGCTPAKQSEIIKKFKNGEIRILFATTVLDEGIDVAECNLVIKYHLVTDNIAHLQRKGRARKVLSESILITYEDKNKEREENNIVNIAKIEEAYCRLEKMSDAEKDLMFEKAIIKCNLKRIEEEKRKAEMKEKMSPRNGDFILRCRGCDTYITDSSNIRKCDNQYIVYDPEIWKLVEHHRYSPAEYNHRSKLLGRIHCKHVDEDGELCDRSIGCGMNFKGIMLPTLTCKELIIVEKETQEVKPATKFKELFYPEHISRDELLKMKGFEYHPNPDEEIEALGKASLTAYGFDQQIDAEIDD